MRKVLFLCHGNICRSPMAEFIFKEKTKCLDYQCASRAVSYEEIGNDIYPRAKDILNKHNIPYSRHYAQIITQEDYDEYDDIFVMDESNLFNLNRIIKDINHKVRKLCPYDIEDPWYTSNFEIVYNEISDGIDNYLRERNA